MVGGGGNSEGNGGSGSGCPRYYKEIAKSFSVLTVEVGGSGQPSNITIDGTWILTADAGYGSTGNNYDGGDGYSGGGRQGPFNGGSDGGDGGGAGGGSGTGEDVTDFLLDNFVLSPGAGGEYYYAADGYGGGGGGVLVNGDGPAGSQWKGEGYGGGGAGNNGDRLGLPGTVLLEIVPVKP